MSFIRILSARSIILISILPGLHLHRRSSGLGRLTNFSIIRLVQFEFVAVNLGNFLDSHGGLGAHGRLGDLQAAILAAKSWLRLARDCIRCGAQSLAEVIDANFNAGNHSNIIFLLNTRLAINVAVLRIGCVWCRPVSEVPLSEHRKLGLIVVHQTSLRPRRFPVEVVAQLLAFVFLRFSAH